MFSKIYTKLGWFPAPNEGDRVALLRAIVLRKLGAANFQPVVDEARKIFAKSLEDPASLSAGITTTFWVW